MEWPGLKPNKSHLPHITRKGKVCCSGKHWAAVMFAARPGCFYLWPLDGLQHSSPSYSLSFRLHWMKLVLVKSSDEGVICLFVAGMQRKYVKGETSLSHLTTNWADCKNHRGPASGIHHRSIHWQCVMIDSCFGVHIKLAFKCESVIQKTVLENMICVSIFSLVFAVELFVYNYVKVLWFLNLNLQYNFNRVWTFCQLTCRVHERPLFNPIHNFF